MKPAAKLAHVTTSGAQGTRCDGGKRLGPARHKPSNQADYTKAGGTLETETNAKLEQRKTDYNIPDERQPQGVSRGCAVPEQDGGRRERAKSFPAGGRGSAAVATPVDPSSTLVWLPPERASCLSVQDGLRL